MVIIFNRSNPNYTRPLSMTNSIDSRESDIDLPLYDPFQHYLRHANRNFRYSFVRNQLPFFSAQCFESSHLVAHCNTKRKKKKSPSRFL